MIIEGKVKRRIDGCDIAIPFMINTDTGTYSQWGFNDLTLGQNVDLLEALRDAAMEVGA